MKLIWTWFGVLSLLALGCATTQDNRKIYIEDEQYQKVIMEATKETQSYSGFQNVLDVKVTRLDSAVRQAMVLKRATNFQWIDREIEKERQSEQQKMSQGTEFFLSFFTPESKNDNLAKGDTVWRIFLDVDGKRYPGVVNKVTGSVSETLDLYPSHTRWGTAYTVKFLVPTNVVETLPSRLTMTGPVGSAELDFK
jgi:hypothetical protein